MVYEVDVGLATVSDTPSSVNVNLANLNEENRIKFVTDLAAVSRGKQESTNPASRYKHLLTEAALGTASRPLEFLRVIMKYRIEGFNGDLEITLLDVKEHPVAVVDSDTWFNKIARYSYIEHNHSGNHSVSGYLYTNMRALINAGIPYDKIPYNDKSDFIGKDNKPLAFAVRVSAPMFVFNHIVTHTALSKEARSERVTALDTSDYWLPYDFVSRLYKHLEEVDPETNDHIVQHMANILYHINGINTNLENMTTGDRLMERYNHSENVKSKIVWYMVNKLSTTESQELLRTLGYKKEIYQRAMLELRYKEWVMVGWANDSNCWEHLFLERSAREDIYKNWTQNETKAVVKAIADLYDARSI